MILFVDCCFSLIVLFGFDFVLCVLFVLCCVIVGLFIELPIWFVNLVDCLVILV